jgi:hypothetical protein
MEDAAENYISTYFEITHEPTDTLSSMVIVNIIRNNGGFIHTGDNAATQRLANILRNAGVDKKQILNPTSGVRESKWIGIKIRDGVVQPFDAAVAAETLFKGAKVKS